MEEREPELKFVYHKDLPPTPPHRLAYLLDQVNELSKIPQTVQKSEEWLRQRNSMITASDIGSVLGLCPYKDRESVLLSKVEPVFKKFTGAAIQHGVKYEPVANMIYEHRNKVTVLEFGCIRHHTFDFVGASPDGIVKETGVMVEIKVPSSRVIDGIVPPYYYAQIQFQLHTCLLDRCDFLECKIIEYSEEDYLNDNYEGDFTKHSNGNEKGYVAELFNLDDRSTSYVYSPIGIYGNDLEIWKNKVISKYNNSSYAKKINNGKVFACFTPWYLDHVSCIPVYSNHEWFYSVIPSVREFWDDVIKYRRLGADSCKQYIRDLKEKRKIEKQRIKDKEREEKLEMNQKMERLEKLEKLLMKQEVKQQDSKRKDMDIRDFMEMGDTNNNNNEIPVTTITSVPSTPKSKVTKTKKGKGGNNGEDEDLDYEVVPPGYLFGEDDESETNKLDIFPILTASQHEEEDDYIPNSYLFQDDEEEILKKEEENKKKNISNKNTMKNPLYLFDD